MEDKSFTAVLSGVATQIKVIPQGHPSANMSASTGRISLDMYFNVEMDFLTHLSLILQSL